MNDLNDGERVELNELCSLLVDGVATEAQQRRLEKMLADSEEARRFYVRTMAMSASLFSYAGEMQSDAPEPANVVRPAQWRRWFVPLAAAAVVLGGIALSRIFPGGASPESPDEIVDTVARLSGAKDCQWVKSGPSTGDELTRGQRLDLKSGFAEVTFDSGAQLLLEGPVSIDLRSAWEAEFHRGSLKANVPPEAAGFRVTSAAVEVVDLGTEFSMTAEDGGVAEVFVLKGAVEVRPRDGGGNLMPKTVLREKQARRFAKAGTSDVRDGEHKFQSFARKVAIERLVRPMSHVRWSFDEGAGGLAAAVSNLQTDAHFRLPQSDDEASRWTDGKFGSALLLDGARGTFAKLSAPLNRGARTVAFWVRASGIAGSSDAPWVTLPVHRGGDARAEFFGNHLPGEGVLGALRMSSGAGSAVGTTALRDGKWHHVSAVFGQSSKNAGKPHSKIYVDGILEPLSSRAVARRFSAKHPADVDGILWLGGRPGGGEKLHAAIDELLIADRALAPQEIRYLMRTNALMTPEALAAN